MNNKKKIKPEELKNYLKIHGLKVAGTKIGLIVRVFAASEHGVQVIKPEVEIETGTAKLAVNFIKKKLKVLKSYDKQPVILLIFLFKQYYLLAG